ncbi:MAG: dephospho-CoA kinase [Salinivirgaceae bacterium]|nr:dephospho-CoA kinase [Salinivirgaceae bacterium]
MITIGLTGGIGSGKSFVAQRFEYFGVPCYNCDERAKLLYDTDKIQRLVTDRYGAEAYKGGKLNRQFLASRIFADKAELEWINSIIHPAVRTDFEVWRSSQSTEIVAVESAILYEGGLDKLCDIVVAVMAPLEVRIARVIKRDGASRQQVKQRIENQNSEAAFEANADYVIMNDGVADIDVAIKKIIENQRNAREAKA